MIIDNTKKPVRISAISYLNTLPFVYGLTHYFDGDSIELQLEVPSVSAQKMILKQAEIGLLPVAALPLLSDEYRILDYCIGTRDKVNTVLLLSNVPLQSIKTISLDYDSRTSVELVKILARYYWKIQPDYVSLAREESHVQDISDAAVFIGDKTFSLKSRFAYIYDLATEWNRFTGLPFVFACWVAVNSLSEDFISQFSQAIEFGIAHIRESIMDKNLPISESEAYDYLTRNISFRFDAAKKAAMEKFLSYLRTG
ncbi:MAG: menaquinone biosynthesis protein [Lentimicrobiaceae bacterium]|nr:menaquinone biosynthesis protein [Lentimicrobiaceae bacterium]